MPEEKKWIPGESNYRVYERRHVVLMHGAEFTEVHSNLREDVTAWWQNTPRAFINENVREKEKEHQLNSAPILD